MATSERRERVYRLARYYLLERPAPKGARLDPDLFVEVDELMDAIIDAAKGEQHDEIIQPLIDALGQAIDQHGELAEAVGTVVASLRYLMLHDPKASPAWREAAPPPWSPPTKKPTLPN